MKKKEREILSIIDGIAKMEQRKTWKEIGAKRKRVILLF